MARLACSYLHLRSIIRWSNLRYLRLACFYASSLYYRLSCLPFIVSSWSGFIVSCLFVCDHVESSLGLLHIVFGVFLTDRFVVSWICIFIYLTYRICIFVICLIVICIFLVWLIGICFFVVCIIRIFFFLSISWFGIYFLSSLDLASLDYLSYRRTCSRNFCICRSSVLGCTFINGVSSVILS